jgi:hypothetical protein
MGAGAGVKGQRWYDWAWIIIEPGRLGYRWLLIRRNRHTRELAFYRCYAPRPVSLATLVRVAGRHHQRTPAPAATSGKPPPIHKGKTGRRGTHDRWSSVAL